jgi:hypothetical protein
MNCGFRKNSGRVFCLLAVFAFLAVAAPGCSDGTTTKEEGAGASPLPPSVQKSNKNMEDFMKSQNAAKKR